MGMPVIGLALSIGGSLLNGMMAAQSAQYQAEVQNQQLEVDRETTRIKAMTETNDRTEQYLRAESANRVAAAAAVLGGRNVSYEQGLQPYNKKVVGRDIANIGFNSRMEEDRMSYQIKVNKWNADVEGKSAMVTAFSDALGSIGSYMSRPGGLLA